ncbi:hypothetical protein [Frigidibacter sp. MR17.24]|uniref:hypothetical protein n=1 Tax=Frigidibacter sp. MR17.24 TaxID=3127345 RepID=UPI0030131DD5
MTYTKEQMRAAFGAGVKHEEATLVAGMVGNTLPHADTAFAEFLATLTPKAPAEPVAGEKRDADCANSHHSDRQPLISGDWIAFADPPHVSRIAAPRAAAEAERDTLRTKLQVMHRRAQRVEGRLSRTARFLNSLIGYFEAMDRKRFAADNSWFWVIQYLRSARDHARQGSGMAIGLCYVVYSRMADQERAKVAAAEAERDALRAALDEIACWNDSFANDRLTATGSYGGFDEPGAVETARTAIARPIALTPGARPTEEGFDINLGSGAVGHLREMYRPAYDALGPSGRLSLRNWINARQRAETEGGA